MAPTQVTPRGSCKGGANKPHREKHRKCNRLHHECVNDQTVGSPENGIDSKRRPKRDENACREQLGDNGVIEVVSPVEWIVRGEILRIMYPCSRQAQEDYGKDPQETVEDETNDGENGHG